VTHSAHAAIVYTGLTAALATLDASILSARTLRDETEWADEPARYRYALGKMEEAKTALLQAQQAIADLKLGAQSAKSKKLEPSPGSDV
jgi:hypothetical protein